MPAQVVSFTNFPSLNPKPYRLYCDSNFLIRLLFYHDNVGNKAVLTPRDIACFNFYNLLHADNRELITSVYGFSELMHFYFFWYGNDGIYQVVTKFLKINNITNAGNSIHDKYKYFIINHPSEFKTAFDAIKHRIDNAEIFLNQIGVKILYPLPSPRLSNISGCIVSYASVLLDAFPKIESADAMHLSIAEYLNISHVISLDNSFKDVDDITVYCH